MISVVLAGTGGAGLVAWGVKKMADAWILAHWPAADGEITTSKVMVEKDIFYTAKGYRVKKKYIRPVIRCEYQVGGKTYVKNVKFSWYRKLFMGRNGCRMLVNRFREHSTMIVYYNPLKPWRCRMKMLVNSADRSG